MIKVLAKSIREYKKPSVLAPIFVSGEVILECIIPFLTANLVNEIKGGCSMNVLLGYGAVLLVMAALSLTFGALAGSACATASCGFARNLRKDMFYKIQGIPSRTSTVSRVEPRDPPDNGHHERADGLHDESSAWRSAAR